MISAFVCFSYGLCLAVTKIKKDEIGDKRNEGFFSQFYQHFRYRHIFLKY